MSLSFPDNCLPDCSDSPQFGEEEGDSPGLDDGTTWVVFHSDLLSCPLPQTVTDCRAVNEIQPHLFLKLVIILMLAALCPDYIYFPF